MLDVQSFIIYKFNRKDSFRWKKTQKNPMINQTNNGPTEIRIVLTVIIHKDTLTKLKISQLTSQIYIRPKIASNNFSMKLVI